MAKDDKKGAAAVDAGDFDYSKYLPAGWKADGLHKLGGLTPIYAAEPAFSEKWTPLVGFMDRIEVIDVGGEKEKNPDQRWRQFIRVQVQTPTKAIAKGQDGEVEVVDIKVGSDVLMPISGNIKNINELRAAVADQEKVYLGIFRVTGQLDVGRPSPMWTIDCQIHDKTIAREGRFALKSGESHAPALSAGNAAANSDGALRA